ncbi:hypothetical protein PGB90_000990 [Kerria lacca]
MVTSVKEESSSKCFNGYQKVFSHQSVELNCKMRFAIYLPPQAEERNCPLIYYLSGLTCNEQNFIQKAGAQRFAAQYGYIVVTPDTSPRGCGLSGEDEKWNVGSGAGLYVDATETPWNKHYRMYSYITSELPIIIEDNFPIISDKVSIIGHSMGGHGALLCAFRNPGKYKSVSTFAPVCNSQKCVPFKEAFDLYLGPNSESHKEWNAMELVKNYNGPPLCILIDQGTEDEFLDQLYPTEFTEACAESRVSVILNMRDGYDHGYYFVSTFIEEHFKFHSQFL